MLPTNCWLRKERGDPPLAVFRGDQDSKGGFPMGRALKQIGRRRLCFLSSCLVLGFATEAGGCGGSPGETGGGPGGTDGGSPAGTITCSTIGEATISASEATTPAIAYGGD